MVFYMKTTLVIDDGIMKQLREEAAKKGKTISELVEAALRRALESPPTIKELPPLPSFNGGGILVDISNRDNLYQAMEER